MGAPLGKYFFSLLLGCLILAFSSQIDGVRYIQIGDQTSLCRAMPSDTAEIKYSAFSGTFFEVIGEDELWYQIKTFDDAHVWILKTEAIPYTQTEPVPVTLLGVALPVSATMVPAAAVATPNITTEPDLNVSSLIDDIIAEEAVATAMPTESLPSPHPPPHPQSSPTPNTFVSQKILGFLESDIPRSEALETLRISTESVKMIPESPTLNQRLFKPKPTYTYSPSLEEGFRYPPRPITRYPQLDVDGFYEMKISGRDYRPKLSELSSTDNRWGIIQRDPVYLKLPNDVLLGSPKFDMRFRFNIDGKLADDLTVHYDVEQEPDFPGKYDVSVKYQKQELKFFHLDTEFKNGEFINYRKSLNGVRYTAYDDNWNVLLSAGKQRSEPKKFETAGTGRTEYSVGVRSLLDDSVKVWVNNALVSEGRDYTVNYFDGTITFATVKGPSDYIEVIYEFTNPIEDFIPVLSRKNFVGAQYMWKATETDNLAPKQLQKVDKIEVVPSGSVELVGTTNITLTSTSLVLGTEEVIFNGVPLRRNLDYVVRARKGKIVLTKRTLDVGDQITVNYSYYDTFETTDEIIAQNSRGPYQLAYSTILEDSEELFLEGSPLVRTIDYELDSDGRVQFSYPIKYPSIITVKYRAVRMEKRPDAAIGGGSPFNFGVTYLNEYAKGQDDELVLSVSSENVSFSGNTFEVDNNPLTELDKIIVTVGGVHFSPGNGVSENTYSVDPYTGVFTLSSSYGSSTAVVTYKYRRNYQTTFVFQGQTGVSQYRNTTEITFRDVPLKYKGVTSVRVFNGFVDEQLIPSTDYVMDYGANGDDGNVSITFYKRGVVNPNSPVQSSRQDYPLSGQRVTIVYSHAPEASPDSGTISQRQFGVTFGTKLGAGWRIDTEVSGAENNLTRAQLETEFNGVGQGGAANYNLGFRNIVENSETVYLNDQPQTRDQHYSINYVNGTLRFINLSPSAADAIRVRFRYVDPNGQTQGGDYSGYKFASKVATQFQSGPWTVQGDIKSIDKDYSPISPIQTPRGTVSFGGAVEYKRAENQLMGVDYRRYEQLLPPVGDRADLYRHTDDLGIRSRMFLFDTIDFSQTLRHNLTYSDPAVEGATGNIYSDDASTFSWNTGIGFNWSDSRYVFDRNYSKAMSGVLDGYNRNTSETDSYQMSTEWMFRRVFLLGNTSVRPSFGYSQTTARALVSDTGVESSSKSFSRKIGLGSRFQPIPLLDASFDFSTEEQNTNVNGVVGTPNRLTNYRLDSGYKPYGWLNMAGSLSNTERFSPLAGQKGQIANEARYQLTTFAPSGLMTQMGMRESDPVVSMLKGSYMTYNLGLSSARENDDLKRINSTRHSVAYNGFTPLPGISLSRVSFSLESNDSVDDADTQTTSQNTNTRSYKSAAAKLDVKPPIPLLDRFTYGLGLEYKRETTVYETIAMNGTSNTTTVQNPTDRRVQNLSFDPGAIMVGIPGIFMMNLGSFRTGLEETVYSSVSSQEIEQESATSSNYSLAQDNTDQHSLGANVSLRPLNLVDISGTGRWDRDTYSRNLSQANTGLTYRDAKTAAVSAAYSPWSFIILNGDLSYLRVDQYRSPSLNMSIEELQSTEIRSSSTLFTDYIYQRKIAGTLGVRFNPFAFISFKGSGGISRILDSLTSTSSVSEQTYTEKVGTVGVEFRPIPGLSAGYDYSIRITDTVGGSSSRGYTGKFSMSYTPIQTEFFKVSVTYTRDDNWGRSLNALQQSETQNGTGDRIRYEVIDRNDTVELGGLSINILLPFKGNPYLENVTLTGEGQIKRVTDAFDAQRALTGEQQIGYEISGMVFKATINF